jgi:hypothetical protein
MGRGGSDGAAVQPRQLLRDKLWLTAAGIHPHATKLRSSDELFETLVRRYGLPANAIWSERLLPFLRSHREALNLLYAEHAVLPEAKLLDLVEAPLILERLSCDSRRLREAWPLPLSQLALLASAWGEPLPAAG